MAAATEIKQRLRAQAHSHGRVPAAAGVWPASTVAAPGLSTSSWSNLGGLADKEGTEWVPDPYPSTAATAVRSVAGYSPSLQPLLLLAVQEYSDAAYAMGRQVAEQRMLEVAAEERLGVGGFSSVGEQCAGVEYQMQEAAEQQVRMFCRHVLPRLAELMAGCV